MAKPLTPALSHPDIHHLNAAMGWLELGNPLEAGDEIARISEPFLEHPDVLEVRFQICAAGQSWEAGLAVAECLAGKAPERASGWLHRAYALRRVKQGGLQQAWDALRPAHEKFLDVPTIPYNLACYAAQLDRLQEAWEWLHKAMESAGEVDRIKRMALNDPDLKPLWDRIRDL